MEARRRVVLRYGAKGNPIVLVAKTLHFVIVEGLPLTIRQRHGDIAAAAHPQTGVTAVVGQPGIIALGVGTLVNLMFYAKLEGRLVQFLRPRIVQLATMDF